MTLQIGLVSVIITALLPLCSKMVYQPIDSKSDLAIQYTLGQTVHSAGLFTNEISVIVGHWGGNDVGSLLSKSE